MRQLIEQAQTSDIGDILEQAIQGNRPDQSDCLRLLESDQTHLMGLVAGHMVRARFGKNVTYVNNIILNYTNVCVTDCKFCAFYRPPGDAESYTLTLDQIRARVKIARESFGIRQALIQGGHNPELSIEYYENAFSMIRSEFPNVGIHALSASEIDMIARVSKSSTLEVLSRLKDSGMQSMPGAGAEILVDSVRDVISPKKITSSEWINIMRQAHSVGLMASASMMYGHVETLSDIAEHFEKIARLQEETGGFMAFISWNFEPNNTELALEQTVTRGAGGARLLKMIAISRIMFDSMIPHIQSSWLTNGVGMAQLALAYGADDFGGTLIGEEVVSCTGSRSTELSTSAISSSIREMGHEPVERDNFYLRAESSSP